jgi:hypothetical protein
MPSETRRDVVCRAGFGLDFRERPIPAGSNCLQPFCNPNGCNAPDRAGRGGRTDARTLPYTLGMEAVGEAIRAGEGSAGIAREAAVDLV